MTQKKKKKEECSFLLLLLLLALCLKMMMMMMMISKHEETVDFSPAFWNCIHGSHSMKKKEGNKNKRKTRWEKHTAAHAAKLMMRRN